jgi:hypothetical protein
MFKNKVTRYHLWTSKDFNIGKFASFFCVSTTLTNISKNSIEKMMIVPLEIFNIGRPHYFISRPYGTKRYVFVWIENYISPYITIKC